MSFMASEDVIGLVLQDAARPVGKGRPRYSCHPERAGGCRSTVALSLGGLRPDATVKAHIFVDFIRFMGICQMIILHNPRIHMGIFRLIRKKS